MMKLSDKTKAILKNFTEINQSLSFKKGKKIRTISPMQNILAEAEIDEEIPSDFAIYDLPQFITTIDVLYNDPDIDITTEQYASIKEGKAYRSKYFFSDPDVIISPPEKEMALPSEEVSFTLDKMQVENLIRSANVLKLPDLSVVGEAGVVKVVVSDRRNDTSNDYSIVVGATEHQFSFNFKIENIKLIKGSYSVSISKANLARFHNKGYNLTYFVALEPDSTYN